MDNDKNLIIVQASDSTISSPTLYEYYSYKDIIRSLSNIDFNGQVIFIFHPANSKLSFAIKQLVCNLFRSYYSSSFDLKLYHRQGKIESYAEKAANIISIDYSQSYRYILSKSKKLINYNRTSARLYGPIDKKYYYSGQYSDANHYKQLKNKLTSNLNLI